MTGPGGRFALAVVGAGLTVLMPGGPAQAGDPLDPRPRLGACGPVPGVYQLPGTDACLRLSGFVAADVGGWRAPAVSFAGLPGVALSRPDLGRSVIGADARLSAEVSIPTDHGPARLVVSVRSRHGLASTAH